MREWSASNHHPAGSWDGVVWWCALSVCGERAELSAGARQGIPFHDREQQGPQATEVRNHGGEEVSGRGLALISQRGGGEPGNKGRQGVSPPPPAAAADAAGILDLADLGSCISIIGQSVPFLVRWGSVVLGSCARAVAVPWRWRVH